MGKKLYVGNLTYSVIHTDLEEWFAQYGTVLSAQVITDRDSGHSKGFGFVEMDTDAQAQAAIQGLHDQDHDGRRLTVDEAKPRVARTRSASLMVALTAVLGPAAVVVIGVDGRQYCSSTISVGFEGITRGPDPAGADR